jgi:drug/metabolite transporter (DMT)-like permease
MTILGVIFFKEKMLLQQVAGILISFFGLLLLVGKGDLGNIDLIKNKGDLLIVASSFTWAVYSIVSKRATINSSPLITTFYLFIIMALVTAPFTLNKQDISAIVNLSFNGWLSILFLGIFCSGVGYYLWARALNEMSASRAGAFLYLEPFVTFFFATIMLNENVTIITFLSGLIIIAGVILVNRK